MVIFSMTNMHSRSTYIQTLTYSICVNEDTIRLVHYKIPILNVAYIHMYIFINNFSFLMLFLWSSDHAEKSADL